MVISAEFFDEDWPTDLQSPFSPGISTTTVTGTSSWDHHTIPQVYKCDDDMRYMPKYYNGRSGECKEIHSATPPLSTAIMTEPDPLSRTAAASRGIINVEP